MYIFFLFSHHWKLNIFFSQPQMTWHLLTTTFSPLLEGTFEMLWIVTHSEIPSRSHILRWVMNSLNTVISAKYFIFLLAFCQKLFTNWASAKLTFSLIERGCESYKRRDWMSSLGEGEITVQAFSNCKRSFHCSLVLRQTVYCFKKVTSGFRNSVIDVEISSWTVYFYRAR